MARKDVQLVIRAKDEAGRAVDAITDAINSLVGAQNNLVSSAERSDSVLGELGAALAGLDKELRGVSATDKISQQFDKANAASERLKSGVKATAAEYNRLVAELKKTSAESDKLIRKTEQTLAVREREKNNLKEAKGVQRQLTSELKASITARDRLAAAETKLTQKIETQSGRVTEATQRYVRLSAEIKETEEPTKRLQNSFEASGRALLTQGNRLEKYKAEQVETRTALAATSREVEKWEKAVKGANAAVAEQGGVVARAKENYSTLKAESSALANEQGRLETSLEKSARALNEQKAAVNKTESELTELAFTADRANLAMNKLADESTAKLRRNMLETRREVNAAEAEWREATATVAQLSKQMRATEAPSERLNAQFRESVAVAQRAKAAYTIQRNGLAELQAALRGATNGGFRALGTEVEKVDASLASLTARQARYVAAQQKTTASLAKLGTEAREAATETRKVSTGTASAGRAANTAARGIGRQTAAYRKLYGESRRALSFTQRLRGEVLSLVAAYAGFFAIVEVLGKTVDAFQKLEGATSRLNVVFNGDQAKVAEELDFIRRSADRLGIEFGVLSQEYTKFAVATQGTNIEGEKTRKIFTSVAEAARVNKTSTEDLQGVFVALTQIVSKGTVSMEELRQQLGDRLPGALQLMGAGLGYGADEMGKFIKAIEKGEISSEALVGFADELDRRFGSQLPKALETTTTEIGRFKNNLFQALLTLGEGGFIESFTDLLRSLNEQFRSADFNAFLTTLGSGIGVLVDVLALAVENFDLLIIAGTVFIGLKMVSVFEILRLKIVAFTATTRSAGLTTSAFSIRAQEAGQKLLFMRAQAVAAGTSLRGYSANMIRARAVTAAFAATVKAAFASTGIGLLVLAASAAIGIFATSANEAQEAASGLAKTVDELENAYEAAKGDVDAFNTSIKGIDTTSVRLQLKTLRGEVDKLRASIITTDQEFTFSSLFSGQLLAQTAKRLGDVNRGRKLLALADDGDVAARQMIVLTKRLEDGRLTAAEFREEIDQLLQNNTDEFLNEAGATFQARARELGDAADNLADANASLDLLSDDGFTRRKVQDLLRTGSGKKSSGSGDDDEDTTTRDAIADQRFAIRQQKLLNEGLEEQARREEVIRDARKADEDITQTQLDLLVALSDELTALESAADKLAASKEFSKELKASAEAARFELSLVGKTNAEKAEATAIREAELELQEEGLKLGEDQLAQIKETVRLLQDAESQEDIAEFRKDIAQQIEDKEFELSLIDKEIDQREVLTAVREAEQAAIEAGTKLTDKEREAIEKVTLALNAKAAAEERAKAAKEKVTESEDAVSQLEQRRDALVSQFEFAQAGGNDDRAEQLRASIFGVNEELLRAIENAKIMWGTIGGPEAEAAIEQLNVATLEAQKFSKVSDSILVDWARVGQLFATGLSNAVDSFSEKVAAGENAFKSALSAFRQFASDFLRQIAQMITQQLFLNAISSITGAIPGLNSTGASRLFASGHTGGLVGSLRIGSGNQNRSVHPGVFANAAKFHQGGLPGLRSGEVAAILKKNEEVLTGDDPRNILNGGGRKKPGEGGGTNLTNINVFDPADAMDKALQSPAGQEVLLNWVGSNSAAVKASLENS